MKRVRKGHYGYFSYRKKIEFIKAAVILVGIIILLLIGYSVTHDRKNLMTVFAVVSVLPFANILVVWISLLPFHSRPKEEEEEIHSLMGQGVYSTELALTRKDGKAILLDYVYVYAKGVICYTSDTKLNERDAEKYIKEMLSGNDLPSDVRITKDLRKFKMRVKDLEPVQRSECDDELLRIEGILYAISL